MFTDTQRKQHIERIQQFRYIDDVFFSVAFDGFKRGVELILRTVLNDESILVEEIYTQKDVINWYGRSVRLDVFLHLPETKRLTAKFNGKTAEPSRKEQGTTVPS